ncbi:prephenate dehydrogenase [Roseateles sp. BYS180W]|uniref:Prephenate dehydrogenase n=1 Tax=Roseateles rivi TaxID=3299028 RepID=A0ABW7FY39_9BURK
MFQQLGIIGCGLMGGSFALALKKAGLVRRVVGYSKSPSTTEAARRLGVVDVVADSALLATSGSDLVLLAVPVSATESTLRAIRHLVSPQTLVMDVGSTKQDVVLAAQKALGKHIESFVPAHPIAGKEKSGVANADADLYLGSQVVLTPLPSNRPELVQKAIDVWSALGCRVLRMEPRLHDAAFAAVSHLPHLLAYSYFNAVAAQTSGSDFMSLAGPGFRDFTRIAASEPGMWRDIFLSNRSELLQQLKHFRHQLDAMERALEEEDGSGLERVLRQASEGRSRWQEPSSRRRAIVKPKV